MRRSFEAAEFLGDETPFSGMRLPALACRHS